MKPSGLSEGYNPKWLAFLTEKGITTKQADDMERKTRISLNAEFMCWRGIPKANDPGDWDDYRPKWSYY